MKAGEYIKDKGMFLIVYTGTDLLVWLVMYLFQANKVLIFFVLTLLAGTEVFLMAYDYFRRRSFYRELSGKISRLDQKYLITEVMDKPEFLDGAILYDTLYQVDKSMHENVNRYRYGLKNFKDYIELWIHEVKLPIASLLLILHNDHPAGEQKMREQLQRIENDVEQVLYFARSENAEKDYRIRRYRLQELVGKVLAAQKEQFLYRHIRLETEGLEEEVLTDGKWMEFIIGQIVSNSLKYLQDEKQNGRIRIWAENRGKQEICLHIRDNGIGIPQEDLPRVYDKSFTGRNGRTTSTSTGMGLYLCRKLCNKMGHQIEIHSKAGEYTEVILSFRENGYYDVLKEGLQNQDI